MNAIFRRAYSTKTLIPPNVAAATKVSGASKDASITRLTLPKGAVEAPKPSGPWGRYKARYIDGDNASVTPLLHLIFGVFVVGYTIDYHFHLKHHKNVEHH
ncbi:hypothetical protein RMCBS344292_09240 [Rhizopus microsporus]|nr:hypothetical protein RMCBS344292_09240 [Rhizopus microsporus]